MEPILSVIIPVYNSEKYLERCIKSVEESSLKQLEIILVDDGSVDGSGVMCDKFAENDYRIQVIHQSNKGVSAARNRGLKIARGKYFAFVDSDDYIEADMYEKMIASMEENDSDMVCCGFCREYREETVRIEKYCYEHREHLINAFQALELLLSTSKVSGIALIVANKIGKTDIQRRNRIFFDETIYECEDGVFWCNYIISIKRAVLMNNIFYHYIIHGNNVSQNWSISEKKLSNLVALKYIIHACEEQSVRLGAAAKTRYQICITKLLFEDYCINGNSIKIESLLPQLKCYRKQLYLSKELSLSKKIYYFGCSIIVKYNLGKKAAVLWKEIRNTLRN